MLKSDPFTPESLLIQITPSPIARGIELSHLKAP